MSEHPVSVDIRDSRHKLGRVRVAVDGQAVRVGPVFASLQLGSALDPRSIHSTILSHHGPPNLVQKGVHISYLMRANAILTVAAEKARRYWSGPRDSCFGHSEA